MGFEVRRTSRSYVRPAAATPAGSLELSAIDRVVGLRHMVPSLNVYPPRGCGAAAGESSRHFWNPKGARQRRLWHGLAWLTLISLGHLTHQCKAHNHARPSKEFMGRLTVALQSHMTH